MMSKKPLRSGVFVCEERMNTQESRVGWRICRVPLVDHPPWCSNVLRKTLDPGSRSGSRIVLLLFILIRTIPSPARSSRPVLHLLSKPLCTSTSAPPHSHRDLPSTLHPCSKNPHPLESPTPTPPSSPSSTPIQRLRSLSTSHSRVLSLGFRSVVDEEVVEGEGVCVEGWDRGSIVTIVEGR